MDRPKLQRVIYKDPTSGQINNIVTKACKYDASGNLIKDMDALGFENAPGSSDDDKINNGYGTEYTYNLAGKQLTILDAVSTDNGLQFSTKYDYDALGRKIAETDAKGQITSYTYNNSGKVLTKNIQKSSKDVLELLETDTYDLQDNLTSKKDGNGNVISYSYNAFNKINQEVYPGDDTILPNTVTNKYDVMGNLMESQDSTGNKHLYSYDFKGNQLSDTESKSDGSEAITTSVTYDANGNKTTETDGNNTTKTTTYDALNKVHTVTTNVKNSAGVLVPHTTAYEYDANGNKTSESDWLGNTISYQYDPLNRLIQKQDQLGKVVEKLEYYDNGSQSKDYDALGNATTYEYDKDKRLIKTTDPENHVTSQSYDAVGNIATKTDGDTNVTSYTYNELNKLSTVTNAKGEVTSYTYDLNGNKLTQTDGKGNTITYEYNAGNKLKRRIDQGGRAGDIGNFSYVNAKVESYTYYSDGSMKTKLDRNGQTTNYVYDVHGRLLSETAGDISIGYTYDNNGNQLTMTDSTGTTTRTYDELNRTTSKIVPNLGKTEYKYDIINGVAAGNYAETTTDPKGNVTKKVYDKTGRLYQVYSTTDADEVPTNYNYYDDGSEKSIVYPNGSSEEYTYFKDKTLQNLVNKNSDGTVINSYSYTYDNAKNILTKVEGKGTTSYSYDTLNRLLSVTEPNGNVTSYTYDAAGNRATETLVKDGSTTKTTYIYNEQNRLTDTTEATNSVLTTAVHYDYDNNGNETSEQKSTYTEGQPLPKIEVTSNVYDALNELISTITPDGKTVKNTYNGDGLRTGKETEGSKTQYLYEDDKVILETDGTGNQTARNVQGINLISRTTVETGAQQETTAFYYYNGHADVTKLLNSTAKEEGSYDYDAFGNLTESSESINNPYRYAGYEYDKETNTYYLKCRMYDPETGRFLQEDSYSGDPNDPLSLNLYTYCKGNPLIYSDPTGHDAGMVEYDATHPEATYPKESKNIADVEKEKAEENKLETEDKPYKETSNEKVAQVANKVVKKDIFDIIGDWITGDSSPKTQYEQLIDSQYSDMAITQQTVLSDLSWDYYDTARGVASIDRVNEIFEESSNGNSSRTYNGVEVETVDGTPETLYHYTNQKGLNGILESNELRPSLKANNAKDARYGNGQYLSDINPENTTPASIALKFIRVPNKYKYTNFIEIDVFGLNVTMGRNGVYVIPNEDSLDITGRIIRSGKVGK